MKPTKAVVSGYIGFNNFGDESIFSVLCQNLKEQGVQITAISSNPNMTALLYGVKAIKTFDFLRIVNAIIESDILISGGGSLLQDKTSLKSLLYYLFIILCAKIFGKKVIIFAQGIGPLTSKQAQFATKNVLRSCNLLTVRDEKSLFLLRGWGINAELQPDPVFNLELPAYSPQGHVGIQLRDWKYLTKDFLNALADSVVKNFSDREILIFSFQDSIDLDICKKFQTELKARNPIIKTRIIQNNSPSNLVENMKTLEYLIGMRFHACLVALKFGIKTLAINYDEKVEKLAHEADIPIINLDKKEEIEYKIELLKQLKTSSLFEYANGKKYDFTAINNLIGSYKKEKLQ